MQVINMLEEYCEKYQYIVQGLVAIGTFGSVWVALFHELKYGITGTLYAPIENNVKQDKDTLALGITNVGTMQIVILTSFFWLYLSIFNIKIIRIAVLRRTKEKDIKLSSRGSYEVLMISYSGLMECIEICTKFDKIGHFMRYSLYKVLQYLPFIGFTIGCGTPDGKKFSLKVERQISKRLKVDLRKLLN